MPTFSPLVSPLRRRLLQAAATAPAWLAWPMAHAAPDPSRLALVIGNSAYRQAPLNNPGNDARAMANLMDDAGLTLHAYQNASLVEMQAAIERFDAAVRDSQVREVFFYYAGHGVQLDWRNYLLPVDAQVASADDLRARSIDLNQVLERLASVKDKTFVIILDACRNNPFGESYRPPMPGLSQFDAPVGSLIAYATAPGSVASDGPGKHGLYTEYLVHELSQPGARLEDAFKRVRLNVRLASKGDQIPWETTSLERDVFLYPKSAPEPAQARQEQELERDFAEWAKAKASSSPEETTAYLRHFPNGLFAEIAQARLARLLAGREKPVDAVQVAVAAPVPVQVQLDADQALPERLTMVSANPWSAGRFALGRVYTVGDVAQYVEKDLLTKAEVARYETRVTRVDTEGGSVEFNDGETVTDLLGNPFKLPGGISYREPAQFFPAEVQVGKKWRAVTERTSRGGTTYSYYDVRIAKREKITVPAGEFDCFLCEAVDYRAEKERERRIRTWLVPGLNFNIRREVELRDKGGRMIVAQLHELVSLRQQAKT